MRWIITFERVTENKLNVETVRRHLGEFANIASQNKVMGFTARVGKLGEPVAVIPDDKQCYRYLVRIQIKKLNVVLKDEEEAEAQFQVILKKITKAAFIKHWVVIENASVAGEDTDEILGTVDSRPRPPFVLPYLDDEVIEKAFGDIYERESHIRIIHDAMRTYHDSSGTLRSHILLYGRPAAAKTMLFERFKQFYDDGAVERVVFVDGPTMTKAGLENWFMDAAERKQLPEVVVIEEIEKQNMDNLLTLLSLMGSGHIMKTNARVGRVRSETPCVIWATCNDADLLRKFRNGALYSRFTHKLYCARPSRELMHKILLHKVADMNGDPAWANEAMMFAYDVMMAAGFAAIEDPREIIGLLDGGDRLMDNSYQTDILRIILAQKDEEDRMSQKGIADPG